MPAGHNGPWREEETPLRNTGNWLHLFLWAHERTGKSNFRRAAERAAKYLLDPSHRPGNGAFLHRPRARRREGNGLIGQAWTLGALFHAHRRLGWDGLETSARSVLARHAFDPRLGLWRNLGLDGRPQGANLTLNQQVWFAAVALQDPHASETLVRSVRRFLDVLPSYIRLSPSGRIEHRIDPAFLWKRFPGAAPAYVRAHLTRKIRLEERSEGYHAFVLNGLGVLGELAHERGGLDGPALTRAVDYARSGRHKQALEGNRFAFGYNPTGIEVALACVQFRPSWVEEARAWVTEQFRQCYDFESNLMVRNSPDPPTLAARICEAVHLPDLSLDLRERKR